MADQKDTSPKNIPPQKELHTFPRGSFQDTEGKHMPKGKDKEDTPPPDSLWKRDNRWHKVQAKEDSQHASEIFAACERRVL